MGHPLSDITVLDQYRQRPLIPGLPSDRRTLFSPVDDVHAALVFVISSAQVSLDIAMYGFDDEELCKALITAMQNPAIRVRLTLDSSQATGAHEKALLATPGLVNSDISVGTSEKGAIMHLKAGVVDGTVLFTGSTNWSGSGEAAQDNQLTVALSTAECVELSQRIDGIHAYQLAHPAVAS